MQNAYTTLQEGKWSLEDEKFDLEMIEIFVYGKKGRSNTTQLWNGLAVNWSYSSYVEIGIQMETVIGSRTKPDALNYNWRF